MSVVLTQLVPLSDVNRAMRCAVLLVLVCGACVCCSAAQAQQYAPLEGDPFLTIGPQGVLSVAWTAVEAQLLGFQTERVESTTGSTATGFDAPQVISEAGDAAQLEGVASDGQGDELAVWSGWRSYDQNEVCDGGKYSSRPCPIILTRGDWYATRQASGSFSAPRVLVPPTQGQYQPSPGYPDVRVAMNEHGESAVAYEARDTVYFCRGDRTGDFGAPVELGTAKGLHTQNVLTYVGLDEDGEALVVWEVELHGVYARFLDSDGRLGPLLHLSHWMPAYNPVAALGAGGQAIVAWEAQHGSTTVLDASYRPAGGEFGAIQTPADDRSSHPLAAGVDGAGAPTLVSEYYEWRHHQSELLVTRGARDGVLSDPMFVGTTVEGSPNVASDAQGDLALATIERGRTTALQVLTSQADGPFAAPLTVAAYPADSSPPAGSGVPAVAVSDLPVFAAAWISPEAENVLLLNEWVEQAAGPIARISLPSAPEGPIPYAPASVLELGETARVYRHDQLHGRLQCGSEPHTACQVELTIRADTGPSKVLAHETVMVHALTSRKVSLALNGSARALLAAEGSLRARVQTRTRSADGPVTEDVYPLLIVR
jgi:hypothetical protein